MLIKAKKMEFYVIKWSIGLLLMTIIFSLLIRLSSGFITSLSIGTIVGIIVFALSCVRVNFLLNLSQNAKKTPPIILTTLFTTLSFIIPLLLIYLAVERLNTTRMDSIVGLFLGIGYTPLVILIISVLQNMRIIRNNI